MIGDFSVSIEIQSVWWRKGRKNMKVISIEGILNLLPGLSFRMIISIFSLLVDKIKLPFNGNRKGKGNDLLVVVESELEYLFKSYLIVF